MDEEFGGRVNLVIGHSTGGFIGFCLAAGHPDRFGHIVIAGAALWNHRADRANLEFSRLLVAGRTREAGEHAVRTLGPGIRVPGLATVLGVLLARASLTVASAEDLLVTAEALHTFDPQQVLPSIRVPVLLVVGDKDVYSTPEEVEKAAELIPNCTLRLYKDTNHFGAITSPRFAADAREFIARTQQPPA
jgi:pimeloyl-ACP methyl ester carboxylesterase